MCPILNRNASRNDKHLEAIPSSFRSITTTWARKNDAPPQVAAHELSPPTVCPDAEWQSKASLTSGRGTTDPLEELTPAHRCRRASIGPLQGENTVAKAIRFCETGGPEVMRWEGVEVGDPGRGEVRMCT